MLAPASCNPLSNSRTGLDYFEIDQPIDDLFPAGLRPNAHYDFAGTDDLPQPGSLGSTRPCDHHSNQRDWSSTTLDEYQTDGAGVRLSPLSGPAPYNEEFLLHTNRSYMGPLAKFAHWDPPKAAAYASRNPADLEDPATGILGSTQPSTISSKGQCECLSCLHLGERWSYCISDSLQVCRVPGCVETLPDCVETLPSHRSCYLKFCLVRRHEREHFYRNEIHAYVCNSSGCKKTLKRWEDLVRHTTNKHCLNPERFPCPEIGCKYSGNNGFVRKDKFKSHYKNVHEGKPRFAQRGAPTLLQPAPTKPSTSALNGASLAEAHEHRSDPRRNKRVRRN